MLSDFILEKASNGFHRAKNTRPFFGHPIRAVIYLSILRCACVFCDLLGGILQIFQVELPSFKQTTIFCHRERVRTSKILSARLTHFRWRQPLLFLSTKLADQFGLGLFRAAHFRTLIFYRFFDFLTLFFSKMTKKAQGRREKNRVGRVT